MLGIVILNYNTWKEAYACINSILQLDIQISYKVYLIDNASSDLMPDNVKQLLDNKTICYYKMSKNKGYAVGNNFGIKKALSDKCKKILIVNSDVIFLENAIENMYNYLSIHTDVGIVGPKVLKPNGKMQETNLACSMSIVDKYLFMLRKTPLKYLSQKFVNNFQILEEDLCGERRVFSVSGCCFMAESEVIKKIGCFDENTFLYYEEFIIGKKMEAVGLSTVLLNNAEVIHKQGQMTKFMNEFLYMCLVESELYYFRTYLKCCILSLLPLYIIRWIPFFLRSIIYSSYRKKLIEYTRETWRRMVNFEKRLYK